jgi:tetratricopeptide (TPR) repeat protein
MLRAAGNHDGDRRSSLEDAAIITAVMRRQVDSMRDEINNEIDDESRRKKLIERLDGEEVEYAASRGDAEALQKVLAQARRKEERARAMARLAILLEKKGEHEKALKYLEEAHSLVRINISDESKANALLDLILAYALIEPATAFMLLERAIDRTNEEISKALLLEMFVKSGMIRKGEILFQNNGGIPADFAVFKYGEGVAALATADFIRTKGLADRFQRNELRLMARLLLARALLTRQSFESATQVPQ